MQFFVVFRIVYACKNALPGMAHGHAMAHGHGCLYNKCEVDLLGWPI